MKIDKIAILNDISSDNINLISFLDTFAKFSQNTEDIEDEILRDFGIIAYSNKIKDEEYQNLISMVKMGVDLGILEKIDDTKMKKILNYSNPYTLAKYLGQDITNLDIEKERAKILKEIINK